MIKMAKKRKNDTSLDPFSTSIESSSLDALLEQANAGDVISIDILRAGNTGAVNLRSSGSTNFYIEKIL